VRVLHHVTLKVRRREIVAVIGRNGAGKTTLLRSIAGLAPCGAAGLTLAGRSLLGLAPEDRSRCGLAYVAPVPNVFPGMTVLENLLLGGWATGNRDTDMVVDVLPPLGKVLASPVCGLGQLDRQLCAIGRTLMTRPVVMLLDDPVRSLAPAEAARLRGFLPDILAGGVSVLFSDHDPEGALAADWLYVLDRGLMVCDGRPTDVLTDPRFLAIYKRGSSLTP
jgi:branched-chain amino acid transport system ATP-binding protein